MSIRRGVALCAAVLAAGAWFTAPAPGGTNYGYQHLDTRCVVHETSYGQTVAAQTTWRMWSYQEASPDAYRWRARLIPTRPGLNSTAPGRGPRWTTLRPPAPAATTPR